MNDRPNYAEADWDEAMIPGDPIARYANHPAALLRKARPMTLAEAAQNLSDLLASAEDDNIPAPHYATVGTLESGGAYMSILLRKESEVQQWGNWMHTEVQTYPDSHHVYFSVFISSQLQLHVN